MNEKYNGIDNLDYTIELDGDEYNLTAADSLWADIARKVKNALTIEKSTLAGKTSVSFDGSEAKSVSVVPSDGGEFSGSIKIPDHSTITDSNKGPYAINRSGVEGLIADLTGLPTYKYNDITGELNAVNSPPDRLAAFRVVVYGYQYQANEGPPDGLVREDDPYPTFNYSETGKVTGVLDDENTEGLNDFAGPPIHFKDADGNNIDCYFLAVNANNGWMSLGHCYTNGKLNYQPLYVFRAAKADQAIQAFKARSIAQINADGTVATHDGTNEPKDYSWDNLSKVVQEVLGTYKVVTENKVGHNEDGLVHRVSALEGGLGDLEEVGGTHINSTIPHRLITYGSNAMTGGNTSAIITADDTIFKNAYASDISDNGLKDLDYSKLGYSTVPPGSIYIFAE